jgi:hypothetical protein
MPSSLRAPFSKNSKPKARKRGHCQNEKGSFQQVLFLDVAFQKNDFLLALEIGLRSTKARLRVSLAHNPGYLFTFPKKPTSRCDCTIDIVDSAKPRNRNTP